MVMVRSPPPDLTGWNAGVTGRRFHPGQRRLEDTMELIKQADEYIAPTLTVLGTVAEVTLGTAGNDNADDTQYWQ